MRKMTLLFLLLPALLIAQQLEPTKEEIKSSLEKCKQEKEEVKAQLKKCKTQLKKCIAEKEMLREDLDKCLSENKNLKQTIEDLRAKIREFEPSIKNTKDSKVVKFSHSKRKELLVAREDVNIKGQTKFSWFNAMGVNVRTNKKDKANVCEITRGKGWRLPTEEEFKAITNYVVVDFKHDDEYWTSTEFEKSHLSTLGKWQKDYVLEDPSHFWLPGNNQATHAIAVIIDNKLFKVSKDTGKFVKSRYNSGFAPKQKSEYKVICVKSL